MKFWRIKDRPLRFATPAVTPEAEPLTAPARWTEEDQKRNDESMAKLSHAVRLTTGLVHGMQLHTEGLLEENKVLRAGIESEIAWLEQCHEPDGDIAPYGFTKRRDALRRLLRDHGVGICTVCDRLAPLLDGECPDCRH